MPRFVIQHRAPGPLGDPSVPWDDVAAFESAGPAEALGAYCTQMRWFGVRPAHDTATVPGVGFFRAVPGHDAPLTAFVVQRQNVPGPGDRHITWSDVDVLDAFDEASAIRDYCERHQWESVSVSGSMFRPYGLGMFRMVPAHLADQMRVTPAP